MIIVDYIFSFNLFWNFGLSNPYLGLVYILGLLFGSYGALGSVLANTLLDFFNGYPISIITL